MDNLKYSISYNMTTTNFSNITDGTITFDNFDTDMGKQVDAIRIKYLNPTSEKITIKSAITIKFIEKSTGKVFDINSPTADFKVLLFSLRT